MRFISETVIAFCYLAGLGLSAPVEAEIAASTPVFRNNSQEFKLVTKLKPGQPAAKAKFGKLWLTAYHSGAGLNDAVFETKELAGIAGFMNRTKSLGKGPTGVKTYPLEFILGDYPYALDVAYVNSYTGWNPVHINVGQKPDFGANFINSTGLQFTTSTGSDGYDGFGGWLVCQWWRGVPQLFAINAGFNDPVPSSCAHVWLMPKYI